MPYTRIATGAAAGAIVTAPLMGVLYLARELFGLPFLPFDLFDWVTRILPGPIVTFGLDLFIDALRLFGFSVADTAKTAELGMAMLQFFGLGVAAGAGFAVIAPLLKWDQRNTGYGLGIAAGAGMSGITLAIQGSTLSPVIVVVWVMAAFVTWSSALAAISERLQRHSEVAPEMQDAPDALFQRDPEPAPEPQSGAMIETQDPADEPFLTDQDQAPAMGHAMAGATGGINRRDFIVHVGGSAAVITIASTAVGNYLATAARREIEENQPMIVDIETGVATRMGVTSFPNDGDPLVPAPGTRLEYTQVEDHYQVFIRARPTVIEGATWAMPLGGLVGNPLSLSIEDFRNNYEPRSQFITLSCISNRVGGSLISTTHWTGASLQDVLADAQPLPDAKYLIIRSGDGFHETVDLELVRSDPRIMLAYSWDERPIPVDHGFPLRIWLPDRYGMKQPKWITEMELAPEYEKGYWVSRGWDEVARVRATAVVDTIAEEAVYERGGQSLVPIGGIAFAGARGISRVQVRIDDGPWEDAQLRSPLSDTTWVIWRYDWPFASGRHNFHVRCFEADGTEQIDDVMPNRPSGATGIHRLTESL